MTTVAADKALAESTPMHLRKELFGHPAGLYVLFLTEMWERFSYYGMRALLVYYMTKQLFLAGHVEHVLGYNAIKSGLEVVFGPLSPQALSSQIYGLYTGFVYLTPLLGGMLADRLIGQRRAVTIGAVIMACGQFILGIESLFYIGLLVMVIGNGFFKPNISTQVGLLYKKGDSRRDRGFNIFYVGINTGAFMAPLVCGTLGETVGWAWGFRAAGIGMLLGLVIYLWGQRFLAPDSLQSQPQSKVKEPLTKKEFAAVIALFTIAFLNLFWWGIYEQQGNTLALWADAHTERHIFAVFGSSWEMPASWFQAFNPFWIVVLTPLINLLWRRQSARGKEPGSLAKMAIACFVLGSGFLLMLLAASITPAGGRASVLWLVFGMFLATTAELHLSPVGLSLVTKIAPAKMVSMMMGVWFLSNFAGNYMTGLLGTYWERMPKESFFLMCAAIVGVTGVVMVLIYAPLKRAVGNENAAD